MAVSSLREIIWATMAVAPAAAAGADLVAREARFPRLLALVLDTLFVSVITVVATAVYGVQVVTWGSPITGPGGSAMWGTQTVIPVFWSVAIWLVYYAVCEAMFSATPGKALTGVVVVRVDGRPVSLTSILARNAMRLLDALPLMYLIGGISVLATAHSQRLGDLGAQTTVVLRRRVAQPSMTRSAGRAPRLGLVAALAALLVFTAVFDYFGRPPSCLRASTTSTSSSAGRISSPIRWATLHAPLRRSRTRSARVPRQRPAAAQCRSTGKASSDGR